MLDALDHRVQAIDTRPPAGVVARPALPVAAHEGVRLIRTCRVAISRHQRQPGVAEEHIRCHVGIAGREDHQHVGRRVVELALRQLHLLQHNTRVHAVTDHFHGEAVAVQIALIGLRQRRQSVLQRTEVQAGAADQDRQPAGGVRGGKKLKAVIPGGSSSPVIPGHIMMDVTMDYDAIAKAGSMLGSGAVIVMDDSRDMVECLLRLSYFYSHESCGQCTPCREGTGWLWRVVNRIQHGEGRPEDIELLDSVSVNIMGRTICALGDAAAMPVRAMIKHFRHEFEAKIQNASKQAA